MQRRITKVYLDTSVISALFDERSPDRKYLTEEFWRELRDYNVYISTLVKEEIEAASKELRTEMIDKIRDFEILEITDEVERLAEEYLSKGIFPEQYKDDAIHVAVAVVNNIYLLISWNFRHLVKVKTRRMVNLVNEVLSYPHIEIIAPPEI